VLKEKLGVAKGAASALALMNDTAGAAVRVRVGVRS